MYDAPSSADFSHCLTDFTNAMQATTLRKVYVAALALLIVPIFLPDEASADSALLYFDCVDHAGGTYRLRQQRLDGKFQSFFAQCVTRQELPTEAAIDRAEMNIAPPLPKPTSPATIVFPAKSASRPASDRTRRANAAPLEIQTLINQIAGEFQIDAPLLHAIVRVESGFRTGAVSPKGALGLMQIMPATARRFGVTEPSTLLIDPAVNLRVGARYFRELFMLFEHRVDLALAAYNAGEGAVLKHGHRIPPFRETRAYVASVMEAYRFARAATSSSTLGEAPPISVNEK